MYVYVLKSKTVPERHYVGITKDVRARLKDHNDGKVTHTSKSRPWKLIVTLKNTSNQVRAGHFQKGTSKRIGPDGAAAWMPQRERALRSAAMEVTFYY